jgi:hypothetical protein
LRTATFVDGLSIRDGALRYDYEALSNKIPHFSAFSDISLRAPL